MSILEIKHLKLICAIAETGTITKAADALFVTQSALSQQLKDLEDKLRVQLFSRTRKKMILTETGKMVMKNARHVLETLEDTEREILTFVSGAKGELKVGTQCSFCFKWLPGVMRSFQDKYPGVEIEIGHSTDLVRDLESKRFDLVISTSSDDYDHLTALPLFEDRGICVMPRDHALSAHHHVLFEDFGDFNMISHTDKETSRFYQMVLKPRGIHPKRFLTLTQPQAMIEMIAAGFGIALFPRWAVCSVLEDHGLIGREITKKGLPLAWQAFFLPRHNIPVLYKDFAAMIGRHHRL